VPQARHDQLTDGPHLRILAVVDDFTREYLALVVAPSLSGLRVDREVDAIIAERGKPTACVCHNGTELNSAAILPWSQQSPVTTRARQTAAERLHRKLQRPSVQRVSERDAIQLARPYPNVTGPMAARPTTPFCHTVAWATCR
jgi:transposase InsO family protein